MWVNIVFKNKNHISSIRNRNLKLTCGL